LTSILIFVPLGQDQEQESSYGNGATALRAIEFHGLELLEISLGLLRALLICRNKMIRTVFHKWDLGFGQEVVLS